MQNDMEEAGDSSWGFIYDWNRPSEPTLGLMMTIGSLFISMWQETKER
jgi:hypothetical protein